MCTHIYIRVRVCVCVHAFRGGDTMVAKELIFVSQSRGGGTGPVFNLLDEFKNHAAQHRRRPQKSFWIFFPTRREKYISFIFYFHSPPFAAGFSHGRLDRLNYFFFLPNCWQRNIIIFFYSHAVLAPDAHSYGDACEKNNSEL